MLETLIKLKRFIIPFIILIFIFSIFGSTNPLSIMQFYFFVLINIFLKIIFQIPTGLVNMVLGNTPLVLTTTNFFFYFSGFLLLSLSVYSIIGYFVYQLLTYRGEYGSSIGRTFLDFFKGYVSFEDVLKKTMNFFGKNPFFSIISGIVIILFISFSSLNIYNTYIISSDPNIQSIKITKDSAEKYFKDLKEGKSNTTLVANIHYLDGNNAIETITTNGSKIVLKNDISIKTLGDLWNLSTTKFPISNDIIATTIDKTKKNIQANKTIPYNGINIENQAKILFNKSIITNTNIQEIKNYTSTEFINDAYKFELINNLPNASLKGMYFINFFVNNSQYFVYKNDFEFFLKKNENKYNNNTQLAVNDYFNNFKNGDFVSNFNYFLLFILLEVFGILNGLVLLYYYIRKIIFNEYLEDSMVVLNTGEKIKVDTFDSKTNLQKDQAKEQFRVNDLNIVDDGKTFSQNLKNDVFSKEIYDIGEKREIEKNKIKEELNNFIDEQANLFINEKLENKALEIHKEYETELKSKVSDVYNESYLEILDKGLDINENDDEQVVKKKEYVNSNIEKLKDLKNESLALQIKDKNYTTLLLQIENDIKEKEKNVSIKNELDKIDNELEIKKMLLNEETIPEKRVIIKNEIKELEEKRLEVYNSLLEQSGNKEKIDKVEEEYNYLKDLSKNYSNYKENIEEVNNINEEIKNLLSTLSETGDTEDDKKIIEQVNYLEIKKEKLQENIQNQLKDMISGIKDDNIIKKIKNISGFLQKKEELNGFETKLINLNDYLTEVSIYERRDKEIEDMLKTETNKDNIEKLEKELKLNKLKKHKIKGKFIKNGTLKKDDLNKSLDKLYSDRDELANKIKNINEKLEKVPNDIKSLSIEELSNLKENLFLEHIEKAGTDVDRLNQLKEEIDTLKSFSNIDFNKNLYETINKKELYEKEKEGLVDLMKTNSENLEMLKYEILGNIYACDENEERKKLIKEKIDKVQKEEFNKYDQIKKSKLEEYEKQIVEENKIQIEKDYNKIQDLNLMNFEIQQIRDKIKEESLKENNETVVSILEEELRGKLLKRDLEYDLLDLGLKTENGIKLQNLKRKLLSTQKESINYKVIQGEIEGIKKELIKEIKMNEKKILDFNDERKNLEKEIKRLTKTGNSYELGKVTDKLNMLKELYIKEGNETKVAILKKLYKEMF